MASFIANNNPTEKILYLSLENNLYDIYNRGLSIHKPKDQVSYSVIYNPKVNTSDIEALCKKYKVLVVDYLGRITPSEGDSEKGLFEQYGHIADELHYLADKYKCIIITACQLNRSALSVFKNKGEFEAQFLEIEQDSLAQSADIVRNVDSLTVVWLHNDSFYIHNIASRIYTKNEACQISLHNKTLALSTKGGMYIDVL